MGTRPQEREQTMNEERTEFGFRRNTCACTSCANNCRHIPGMLIPADIPRIARHLGYADVMEFARDNLLASPGALVIKDDHQIRIHTLVPQRGEDGACKFLKNNLCLIHQVAPYGCAFFSDHESRTVGDTKSTHALANIIRDAESKGRYARVWRTLDAEGLNASAPEDIRARMNAESSDR